MQIPRSEYPSSESAVIDVEKNIVEFTGVHRSKCKHIKVVINTSEKDLECADCGTKLNAIVWLMNQTKFFQSQFQKLKNFEHSVKFRCEEIQKKIDEDKKELKKRSRTRCQHCKRMTAINLKHSKITIVE